MAKKLLVADDSLTIQKVIKLALSGDGYEIQTVSDGTECLQQVALFRPDVILIDIGLPGRSAFDLKKAANDDPDLSRIPFVLMSSAFEKVDEAKVALLRFDGRLTKPFDPSNLKEVLSQAMKMNSGEALRGFAPSAAPSGGFSLDPSERSREIQRPKQPGVPMPIGLRMGDSDVTGEIKLADPSSANIPVSFDLQEPSPSLTSGNDPLWNDSPTLSGAETGSDSDIRQLTESTVKMSGLDDLGGWNIEENAKSSLPPIPEMFSSDPTRSMTDIALPSSITLSPTSTHGLDLELTPPPAFLQTGTGIQAPPPMPPAFSMPPSPSEGFPQQPPFMPSSNSRSFEFDAPNSSPSPSQATLESIVEKQVREQLEMIVHGAVKAQLEQMARKALPEIAERVVKQEIRKLLEGLASNE